MRGTGYNDNDGLIDQAEFRIWAEEKSSIVQSYLKVVSVLPTEGTALPGQGTGFGATDGATGGGAKTAQVVTIKQGSSCCVVLEQSNASMTSEKRAWLGW